MNLRKVVEALIPHGILEFAKKNITINVLNYVRNKYKKMVVQENSVLVIELTGVHGENLPSLAKYLLDLHYNVDILLKKPEKKENNRNDLGLFACFNDDNRLKIRVLSGMDINLLLRSAAITLYRHVVVGSFCDRMKRNHFYRVDLFKLKPICMIHNPDTVNNDYFKTNKIISLVKMNCINREPPCVISCHYFGDFPRKEKSKKTVFATLNTKDLSRRNLYLLFSACDNLYKKNISNFTVKIIGNGLKIPERFRDNFYVFGFLDFQKMYKEIETADFFLALIDQASIKYTNKASGSYGLSYGFIKPIILHRKFSSVSSFNDENSVLYDDNNDLSDAMEKCINISNDRYQSLVFSLENSGKELYNTSLCNFKEVLETPIRYVSYDKIL